MVCLDLYIICPDIAVVPKISQKGGQPRSIYCVRNDILCILSLQSARDICHESGGILLEGVLGQKTIGFVVCIFLLHCGDAACKRKDYIQNEKMVESGDRRKK